MTLRSQRSGRSADVAPTRSSATRVGLTVLGCAVGLVGAAGALLGTAPSATAAPIRVVPLTVAQVAAIAPMCPTAYSITDTRTRPIGVTRAVAVATCLQYFRSVTRLEQGVDEAPAQGAVAPSIQIQLRPVVLPAPAPSTVTVRVPVPVAPSTASGGSSSGGSSSGGSSSGGSSSGGSSSGGSSAGTASVPIGDDAAPATTDPIDPGTTPAPSVAPLAAPAAAAPALTDPGAATTAPVAVTGSPGTVSDPTTKTAASATSAGTGEVLPLALVLGAIVLATVLGVGLRYAVTHDRLPTMPWSRRRGTDPRDDVVAGPDPAPAVPSGTGADLSPAGFVARWLDQGDAGAPTDPGTGALMRSGPPVSLQKTGERGSGDLGAGRPEREVEDMVGVGHH